jgi:hypothetical protein
MIQQTINTNGEDHHEMKKGRKMTERGEEEEKEGRREKEK